MANSRAEKVVPGSTPRKVKAFAAIGVLAAVMIAVNANVLVARWYERWDFTSEKLYSLSPATLELLHKLDRKLSVSVFLGRSDPLSVSVRHLLDVYAAETTKLDVRFVDPDREPAEFLALQQKYGLLAGKAEDGRIVTDASIIIADGERHWFVTSDDIVAYEDASGRAKPRLEQALTEGIASLLQQAKVKACFSTGHRELTREDTGPQGLAELAHRLEKNNFELETIDLSAQNVKFEHCELLVIAAPAVPFASAAAARVTEYVKAGGNLLGLIGPLLDEDQRVIASGLEPTLHELGIDLAPDLILETDEARRLPRGTGEIFFATPSPHAITRGLISGPGTIESRVLISEARSMKAAPGSSAMALLATSSEAIALQDLRALTEPKQATQSLAELPRTTYTLALANELSQSAAPSQAKPTNGHGPRVVVFGSANMAWARNWRDPALYGNRLMLENAVSWLASRRALISVPEKRSQEIGLSLSEEALGEVLRYVLIYMPGSAALLGLFVLLRRRSAEQKSRSEQSA